MQYCMHLRALFDRYTPTNFFLPSPPAAMRFWRNYRRVVPRHFPFRHYIHIQNFRNLTSRDRAFRDSEIDENDRSRLIGNPRATFSVTPESSTAIRSSSYIATQKPNSGETRNIHEIREISSQSLSSVKISRDSSNMRENANPCMNLR